jgi:hypothetical protein
MSSPIRNTNEGIPSPARPDANHPMYISTLSDGDAKQYNFE